MQNDNITQAVEQLKSWRRDETLLVRFYTGETNSEFVDAWIDGLAWRLYDFDMREYLHEEYGIEFPETGTYDIIESDDDSVTKLCFIKDVFSRTRYDRYNDLLTEVSEEIIMAAYDSDEIDIFYPEVNLLDAYIGEFDSMEQYFRQESDSYGIPDNLLNYIDWEKFTHDYGSDFIFSNGMLFRA